MKLWPMIAYNTEEDLSDIKRSFNNSSQVFQYCKHFE